MKQAGAQRDSALSSMRPTKLILDVRHNNGGDSCLYPPIIDALTAWERAMPVGKLYVITGRNTFSGDRVPESLRRWSRSHLALLTALGQAHAHGASSHEATGGNQPELRQRHVYLNRPGIAGGSHA